MYLHCLQLLYYYTDVAGVIHGKPTENYQLNLQLLSAFLCLPVSFSSLFSFLNHKSTVLFQSYIVFGQ